jgi:hypothetical protein
MPQLARRPGVRPYIRGALIVTRRSQYLLSRCLGMLLVVLTVTACGNSPEPQGGEAASSAAGTDTGGTRLEVRVIDLHGRPVVGAEVLLSVDGNGSGDGSRATTDGVGSVRFSDVTAGDSVGVWVAHGGVNVGFAQVGVQTGLENRHAIVVRLPTTIRSSE